MSTLDRDQRTVFFAFYLKRMGKIAKYKDTDKLMALIEETKTDNDGLKLVRAVCEFVCDTSNAARQASEKPASNPDAVYDAWFKQKATTIGTYNVITKKFNEAVASQLPDVTGFPAFVDTGVEHYFGASSSKRNVGVEIDEGTASQRVGPTNSSSSSSGGGGGSSSNGGDDSGNVVVVLGNKRDSISHHKQELKRSLSGLGSRSRSNSATSTSSNTKAQAIEKDNEEDEEKTQDDDEAGTQKHGVDNEDSWDTVVVRKESAVVDEEEELDCESGDCAVGHGNTNNTAKKDDLIHAMATRVKDLNNQCIAYQIENGRLVVEAEDSNREREHEKLKPRVVSLEFIARVQAVALQNSAIVHTLYADIKDRLDSAGRLLSEEVGTNTYVHEQIGEAVEKAAVTRTRAERLAASIAGVEAKRLEYAQQQMRKQNEHLRAEARGARRRALEAVNRIQVKVETDEQVLQGYKTERKHRLLIENAKLKLEGVLKQTQEELAATKEREGMYMRRVVEATDAVVRHEENNMESTNDHLTELEKVEDALKQMRIQAEGEKSKNGKLQRTLEAQSVESAASIAAYEAQLAVTGQRELELRAEVERQKQRGSGEVDRLMHELQFQQNRLLDLEAKARTSTEQKEKRLQLVETERNQLVTTLKQETSEKKRLQQAVEEQEQALGRLEQITDKQRDEQAKLREKKEEYKQRLDELTRQTKEAESGRLKLLKQRADLKKKNDELEGASELATQRLSVQEKQAQLYKAQLELERQKSEQRQLDAIAASQGLIREAAEHNNNVVDEAARFLSTSTSSSSSQAAPTPPSSPSSSSSNSTGGSSVQSEGRRHKARPDNKYTATPTVVSVSASGSTEPVRTVAYAEDSSGGADSLFAVGGENRPRTNPLSGLGDRGLANLTRSTSTRRHAPGDNSIDIVREAEERNNSMEFQNMIRDKRTRI